MEITLNENWSYFFTNDRKTNFSSPEVDDSRWIPLPDLKDWAVGASVQSGADWFRRKFHLPDEGKYTLLIEHVPEQVSVFINGQYIEDITVNHTLTCDISAYVIPGENIISMKVTSISERGGVFGEVRLLPVYAHR